MNTLLTSDLATLFSLYSSPNKAIKSDKNFIFYAQALTMCQLLHKHFINTMSCNCHSSVK